MILNKFLIKTKIVISLILVVTAFLFSKEIYNFNTKQAMALEHLNLDADRIVTRLSKSLALPLWEMVGDQWINKILITEMEDKEIYATYVTQEEGIIVGLKRDSDWNTVTDNIEGDIQIEGYIVRISDVNYAEEKIGTVKVYLTNKFMNQTLKGQMIDEIIFTLILIILISVSLTLMMDKVIIRPVMRLLTFVKGIAENKPKHPQLLISDDEIGMLGTEFNKMHQNVLQREKELLESQSQLKSLLTQTVEREENLSLTLNSIGDAVITTDAEGKITRMNPVAQQLTGWKFDDCVGQPLETIFSIVKSNSRESIANPVEVVLAKGNAVYRNDNSTLVSREGIEYKIADSASAIRSDEGKILGLILVFNDITEQYQLRESTKRAQETLQIKEKEQREILNSMLDSVITIDVTGKILNINQVSESLFGYKYEEILDQNINKLIPSGVLQNCPEIKDGNTYCTSFEVIGLHKENGSFPMRMSVARLPENEAGIKRFVSTCHDLTQIRQQEEMLRRTQKMDVLGKLTGGIAHDYNNMLGVILGYAELLEQDLVDQPELLNFSKQILHAGQRGGKLTKKLLSFSQHSTTNSSKVDLNNLLLQQTDMLEKTLTIRIKLSMVLEDNIWPIWVNISDLEDAILNMSLNAKQARDDNVSNSRLTIHTFNKHLNEFDASKLGLKAGEYVQLTLTDNGCGIKQETMENIFDPFFTTKGTEGTGLGLSQVFGFVKRAGGIIHATSVPGQETQLILYFPRLHDAETHDKAKTHVREDNLKGTETILVVDDEGALRSLCYAMLTSQGYKVISAEDGKRALQILQREFVNLLISDIIMPNMDGYQLAEIVQEKYPDIKIQLMSGFADEQRVGAISSHIQNNILRKPFNKFSLLKSVRAVLDNTQS